MFSFLGTKQSSQCPPQRSAKTKFHNHLSPLLSKRHPRFLTAQSHSIFDPSFFHIKHHMEPVSKVRSALTSKRSFSLHIKGPFPRSPQSQCDAQMQGHPAPN